MSRKNIRALGLAFASTCALLNWSTSAAAQTTEQAVPPAYAANLPRTVLIRDDPDQVKHLPRPATPGREQDRYVMSIEEWNSRYPDDHLKTYAAIGQSNVGFCSITGHIFQRADQLSARFAAHDARFAELRTRVEHLKGSRVSGSWLRRLGGLVSIGVAATISGPYAGVVAGGVLGNEAAASGNDRSQDASRDLMLANIDLTRDNIESNALTLEMDMFWVEMVTPWCAENHPEAGVPLSAHR